MFLSDPQAPTDLFGDALFHWAAGVVAVMTAITLVLVPIFRRLRHMLAWLETFSDDWSGVPPRPGVPGSGGVMERLAKIDSEFSNDGNGSMRTSIDYLTTKVHDLVDHTGVMEIRQIEVKDMVRDTADELKESLEQRALIIENMTKDGEAVWSALESLGADLPPMHRADDGP